MIAEAPGLFYIHEPFSVSDPPGRGICSAEFKYWFTYITWENEADFYRPIKNMIDLRYDIVAALKSIKSVKEIGDLETEYRQFSKHRLQGSVSLIKDPIAVFSSEWLVQRFNMTVVIVIRHPAAFVSSIKKLNWKHPFSHFLQQPLLLKNVLYPFQTEISEYAAKEHDVIDQAILLWRLIHYTIIKYQQDHKDWIFVRHEDLSREPLCAFENLFGKLHLEFSPHIATVIEYYSGTANPSDVFAPVGSESTLKRNSKLNVLNWKNRLTSAEIRKIRSKVEDISVAFYSDEDW
jgi:hypothetical protein